MDNAFKSAKRARLYRIGIASHSYVDTWAHQNFVGWYDDFNHIGFDIKPNIGHADGEHHPDWVSHKWTDSRLVEPEISNKHRFLSAAKELFKKYCDHLKKDGREDNTRKWGSLQKELNKLQGITYSGSSSEYKEDRIQRYGESLKFLEEFDERAWFDEAIDTEVRGIKDTHEGLKAKFTLFEDKYFWRKEINKNNTHWFKFQEAVKAHQKFALKRLSPLFTQMGLDLKNGWDS